MFHIMKYMGSHSPMGINHLAYNILTGLKEKIGLSQQNTFHSIYRIIINRILTVKLKHKELRSGYIASKPSFKSY